MKIEIITPDKKVFEGDIKSVRVPGKKGSFQVLKDHAPIISTLEDGTVIIVDQENKEVRYEIFKIICSDYPAGNNVLLLQHSTYYWEISTSSDIIIGSKCIEFSGIQ